MTQRISIAGIDGTGKTTIIHKARENRALSGSVRAFRAPQYHEDPDAPFCSISKAVDDLSVLGDLRKDPILKATALFLSMTFYGNVEDHFERVYQPEFLLMERQALADSLTYAGFYQALLTRAISPQQEGEIVGKIGRENFDSIQTWISVLKKRSARFFSDTDFWNLPLVVRELFTLPPADLIQELQNVYSTRIPEQIVLLEVSEEALQERLRQKRGSGTAEELHEKKDILKRLQEGLSKSCEFLKSRHPSLKLHRLDTSALSPDQTLERVLGLIQN